MCIYVTDSGETYTSTDLKDWTKNDKNIGSLLAETTPTISFNDGHYYLTEIGEDINIGKEIISAIQIAYTGKGWVYQSQSDELCYKQTPDLDDGGHRTLSESFTGPIDSACERGNKLYIVSGGLLSYELDKTDRRGTLLLARQYAY